MKKKLKFISKIACTLLLVFIFLSVSCPKEPGEPGDDEYNNPNAGASRELKFSHDSGLYGSQFSLTLTAANSTIYYTTNGSIPMPNKSGTAKYTTPIAVKDRTGQANVLATAANSTQFYMEQNDPRGHIPPIFIPNANQVPKATVIRAIAVDSKGKASDVVTKTYFIGNNLAAYGNTRIISIVSDPVGLVSQATGIMVRGNAANRWHDGNGHGRNDKAYYNFLMRGRDNWEREAHFELFTGNASSRSTAFSTGVGIRIRGAYSRAHGQKSFNIFLRQEYGIDYLEDYELIPGAVKIDGTPIKRYKSFMLRSGGNDHEATKFYDVFIHDLLKDRSFTTQAAVPAILYLNGEYWGPYNLQERQSDHHAANKYGINRNDVVSIDNGLLNDGNPGDDQSYWDAVDAMIGGNYAEFCEKVDIDNFVDYWAAQIYIHNEDWPNNNYIVWRTRTVETGNPYGDTKWRYWLHDTEFSMGIYSGGSLIGSQIVSGNAFERILKLADQGDRHGKLFRALLQNENFCKLFVNNMMDLYNVNFHPNNFDSRLTSYAAIYKPLMEGYAARWSHVVGFDGRVNSARNYLNNIRPAMVNNYLPAYFNNIGSAYDVTISAAGVSGAAVKINTLAPRTGSWTGKYYSGVPITLTASAPPSGYEFDGWTVTGGNIENEVLSTRTAVVKITGNAAITAVYK